MPGCFRLWICKQAGELGAVCSACTLLRLEFFGLCVSAQCVSGLDDNSQEQQQQTTSNSHCKALAVMALSRNASITSKCWPCSAACACCRTGQTPDVSISCCCITVHLHHLLHNHCLVRQHPACPRHHPGAVAARHRPPPPPDSSSSSTTQTQNEGSGGKAQSHTLCSSSW